MSALRYASCQLLVCATAAILAACGSNKNTAISGGAVVRPGPLAIKSGPVTVRPDNRPSWMRADAAGNALLYGADFGSNDVDVYTYPKGKLVGTLTGFSEPQGECVDAAGNVWIANTGTSQLIEYAHGAGKPLATLDDPGQYPVSCSVNSINGNLAVGNIESTNGNSGSVSIYKKASGVSKFYSDPNLELVYFLSYDGAGNLFVDGTNGFETFQYAELPKGSAKLKDITLNRSIEFPGDVQYDGKHIAVGDQGSATIYRTSGSKVVGTTQLQDAGDVSTFFIMGDRILCPTTCAGDVSIYAYPTGGAPLKSLTLAGGSPGYVVVSKLP